MSGKRHTNYAVGCSLDGGITKYLSDLEHLNLDFIGPIRIQGQELEANCVHVPFSRKGSKAFIVEVDEWSVTPKP